MRSEAIIGKIFSSIKNLRERETRLPDSLLEALAGYPLSVILYKRPLGEGREYGVKVVRGSFFCL